VKYTQHPLSAAFPAMSADDLESLTNDITTHGQREPGVLYEGQVLDGWHRYQACEAAGAEFVAVEFIDADPVAFVISRNAHRRHLTASQRAAAVVMCAEWVKSGTNQHTKTGGEAASPPPKSNKELATAAGTTVRTVQQAKRAVEAGLGDAVRDGQMSAEAAVAVAKGEAPKAKNTPPRAPDRKPETPEPSQLKTGQGAHDGPTLDEIVDEQEQVIRERDAQIAALSADDKGEELLKQIKLTQHYQREIGMEQDKNARLMKERDELRKWQNRVCDVVGVDNARAAMVAIRSQFSKVAA